ncbi:terminase small subunit [candidate division KSB1 bacterium]
MARQRLTPKQQLFRDEYIRAGFNAAKAARRAGYSERTAKQIGYENLTKPYLLAAIENLTKLNIRETAREPEQGDTTEARTMEIYFRPRPGEPMLIFNDVPGRCKYQFTPEANPHKVSERLGKFLLSESPELFSREPGNGELPAAAGK